MSVAGDVIELKVPLASLNWQSGDPLELLVTASAVGTELDRAPNLNSIVLFSDRTALVEVTFVVDATGTQLALDAVKAIANPVPPKGTGKVFIVGSVAELGNWTPNSIAMSDDGATLGDQTAGDNLWTFRLSVAPGTELNYKYTMGNAGDGWSPTEEYPLTNRGFEVKDTDGDRKMVLHDVFADRPDPSGTLPPRTQVIDPVSRFGGARVERGRRTSRNDRRPRRLAVSTETTWGFHAERSPPFSLSLVDVWAWRPPSPCRRCRASRSPAPPPRGPR